MNATEAIAKLDAMLALDAPSYRHRVWDGLPIESRRGILIVCNIAGGPIAAADMHPAHFERAWTCLQRLAELANRVRLASQLHVDAARARVLETAA